MILKMKSPGFWESEVGGVEIAAQQKSVVGTWYPMLKNECGNWNRITQGRQYVWKKTRDAALEFAAQYVKANKHVLRQAK